jgi:hypothetical protein
MKWGDCMTENDKEIAMNTRHMVLVAITTLVVVAAAACAPAAATPAQLPSVAAGQPIAAVERAPICQTGAACQVPTAEQNEIGCVNKVPYTNVLVEPGTAFEVLDKSGDYTCNDSGMVVGGKTVLTCFGRQLYRFDLKLTNTSCGGAALQAGTGQCEQGYGYDSAQQCCAPISGDGGNSTIIQVILGACPLPRGVPTPQGTPAD